jgi:hypothetical protein
MKVRKTRKGNIQITLSAVQADLLCALLDHSDAIPDELYGGGNECSKEEVEYGVAFPLYDRLSAAL